MCNNALSVYICRMSAVCQIPSMWSSASEVDFQAWSSERRKVLRRILIANFHLQLYPLFVIDTLGRFPGLTGLFIASILSASLSTVSSGVNSIATVFLEDIYKRVAHGNLMSDKKQAMVSKILCESKKGRSIFANDFYLQRYWSVFLWYFWHSLPLILEIILSW